MPGSVASGRRRDGAARRRWRPWSAPGTSCGANWPARLRLCRIPNCISRPTAGPDAGQPHRQSAETGEKNAWPDRKSALNSNKFCDDVLFLLAAAAASRRRGGTAPARGERRRHGVHLYGGRSMARTGSKLEDGRGSRLRRGPAAGRDAVELPAGERMEQGEPGGRRAARCRCRRSCSGLLSACLEYSRQSEGAFDITVGPLMKVWGFYKGTGRLPHQAEVRGGAGEGRLPAHACWTPATRTVRFDQAGVEIDPGGIGKGYAVDRMVEKSERARDPSRRWFRPAAAASTGWARRPTSRGAGRSRSATRESPRRPWRRSI